MAISEGGTTAHAINIAGDEDQSVVAKGVETVSTPNMEPHRQLRQIRRIVAAAMFGVVLWLNADAPASAYNQHSSVLTDVNRAIISAEIPSDPVPPIKDLRLPVTFLLPISQGPQGVDSSGSPCVMYSHNTTWGNIESVDISLLKGIPVVAAASGTVAFVGWSNAITDENSVYIEQQFKDNYGIIVVIDHVGLDGNHYQSLYAHLDSTNVKAGQLVSSGQLIGKGGKTSAKAGHLHFDIRTLDKNGKPVTVPIQGLFGWKSGDNSQTCSSDRYEGIVVPPEFIHDNLSRVGRLKEFTSKVLTGYSISASNIWNDLRMKPEQSKPVWHNTRHGISNNRCSNVATTRLPAPQGSHRFQAR